MPRNESDQARSVREWGENFYRVMGDHAAASDRDIRRAIGYAEQVVWGEKQKAQRGEAHSDTLIDDLEREVYGLLAILKTREMRR